VAGQIEVRRRGAGWKRFKKELPGYLFIAPALLIIVVFAFYPILRSVHLSFTRFSPRESAWVGLANYRYLLTDSLLWRALRVTSLYTAVVVPLQLIIGLVLATFILPLSERLQAFFKAAYYLPQVAAPVIVGLVWVNIYNPSTGLLNYLMHILGLPRQEWLGSPQLALPSIILTTLVTGSGGSVLILLAAMGSIPRTFYEVAMIDGASAIRRFFSITLPLLRPTLLYLVVVYTISSYQVFDLIYVMTEGGPLYSTTTIAYKIYNTGFTYFRFGRASAEAMLLFAIIAVFALIEFRILRADVEY